MVHLFGLFLAADESTFGALVNIWGSREGVVCVCGSDE